MASSSVIGALRVDLSANTAAFEQGLSRASVSLAGFGAVLAKQMAGVSAALAAAFAPVAIGRAIKGAIDLADELGKMAQKIGIPVEQLSALKYAADLSGVSLEGLGGAMNRFNRNLAEIGSGKINDAARALQAMGISATDSNGALRGQTDILLDVADKFSTYGDSANKSALAMALFGKTGADLIPLLNQGAAGIKASTNEAERFHLIVSQRTAVAAQEFNDNLGRLQGRLVGITLLIAGPVVESLNNLGNELDRLSARGERFNAVAAAMGGEGGRLGAMAGALAAVAEHARQAQAAMAAATENSSIAGAAEEAPGLAKTFKDFLPAAAEARDAYRAALDDMLSYDTTPIADKIRLITAAHDEAKISAIEHSQKMRQVNDQQKDAIIDLAQTTGQALDAIFKENKAAAIANVLISTAVGIAKAMELAPPFDFIKAGLVAATGVAQLAAIRSTNKSGGGGSVSMSRGGTASVASSVSESEQQSSRSTSIFVQGIGPKQIFSGESLIAFIEAIKEYQRDGGQLLIQGV